MKLSNINIKNVITSVKFGMVIPVAFAARLWNPKVWIITERLDQARDNGYCFFKYLREKHPECKAYYVIEKQSKDYEKIRQYGNVIQFDSWKHFYYYCISKVHISAHVNGCAPNNSPICRRIKSMLKIKDVFIPHGVSYGVSEFCLKKYADINLFICSGKMEYENVLKNYGYDESEVVYTGFPRLDDWHDVRINRKQILLMPTWRLYLAQNPDTKFEETLYYEAYQEFIQDKKLQDILIKEDLKLIFYLHNDMRKYANLFQTNCSNIEIVAQDDKYDIQELLKSSALLITDYSSVHFDFAYMKKPVLYYQFDKKEFFEKQYLPGIFETEKDGFGAVVYHKEALLKEIQKSIESNFTMQDKYFERMRKFYQIYDKKNCERVYEEILKRQENGWIFQNSEEQKVEKI